MSNDMTARNDNAASNMSAVLTAENLSQTFREGPQPVEVLRGVSFQIARAECVAIVGRSGSGKTTLLHLLGGLEQPAQGSVQLLGQAFSHASEAQRSQLRNRHVGFVYQLHHLLPEFTARENVALPCIIGGLSVREAGQRADDMLERVGLAHRGGHTPAQLSGGERQRVALARALVTQPAVVLADEPTGNLDRDTAEQIHDLILSLNASLQTSFVIVTHEERLASLAHRRLRLEQGVLLAAE